MGDKVVQVAFVANVRSLSSIEHSVNTQLRALQINPEVEIKDVSCGAYIAPVMGGAKREQSVGENNLLWLAVIQYTAPIHHKEKAPENVGAEYVVQPK